MKNNTLSENIAELNDIIKRYLETRVDLWKVLFLEKVTKIGTYLFNTVAVLVAFMFTFLFIALAFSFWYGDTYGNLPLGFLISGGFFLVLAILSYLFRKPIFSNNIVRNIASIIFSDDETK